MTASVITACGFVLVSCGTLSRSASAIGDKIKSTSKNLDGKYDINDKSDSGRGGGSSFDELKSMNTTRIVGELPSEEDIIGHLKIQMSRSLSWRE